MLLSPLGERLGEGVMRETAFVFTPSPNLSPKGERNMSVRERKMSGEEHESTTRHATFFSASGLMRLIGLPSSHASTSSIVPA